MIIGVAPSILSRWYTSLKLTFSHLKNCNGETILSFWDDLFLGAVAVSFREGNG